MIIGVGVDIVPIDRIRSQSDAEALLGEVLAPSELRSGSATHSDEGFSRIFAVKEAVLKALGCGLRPGFLWHDIAVDEASRVRLSGLPLRLAEELSVSTIHVSHSCSQNFAVAFVLLESNNPEVRL